MEEHDAAEIEEQQKVELHEADHDDPGADGTGDRYEDAARDCDQTPSPDHSQITPQITLASRKRPVNIDQTEYNDPDTACRAAFAVTGGVQSGSCVA